MVLDILHKVYTPREFLQHFPIGERSYSRKWSQLVSNGVYCEYDEGYNKFLKIITRSGAEISGKLTYYWDNDLLRIFPPILKKRERHILQYQISIKDIISISVLDQSFPYKFAYDWHAARSEFSKDCFVAIQLDAQTIAGRLLDVHKAFISHDKFFPITFDVAEDPNTEVVLKIGIGDVQAIRILPYTYESLRTFEEDRTQIITRSLGDRVHTVGIFLIKEYLNGDIPDELPKAFYDYLLDLPSI
jgi:hypothetical protein